MKYNIPEEWRARLKQERREASRAAEVFARICKEGRSDDLYDAHLLVNASGPDAWRFAMAKVAKLRRVSRTIREAFLPIWIESKMLPLRVGNRRVMAEALRVLMPSTYRGRPLTLYRGTHGGEHHKRQYGFSWTTDADTARKFAENWAQSFSGYSGDGVILKTRAPGKAILLVRRPEDYYDEGEVVVDPFRLGQVEVVERLCLPGRADWARPNQLI